VNKPWHLYRKPWLYVDKDWQGRFETSEQKPRRNAKSLFPLQAASIAIGIADNSAFFLFQIGPLSNAGGYWMLGALLLWVALFLIGIVLLGTRSLWLLLGLPLVLLPIALAVYGAGQI
jgi:hypothetical protein